MDQVNDPRELKRQLDQAMRLVSVTSDQRTYQLIGEFIEELCSDAWLLFDLRKKSVPALGNFGSSTAALQVGIWSSGYGRNGNWEKVETSESATAPEQTIGQLQREIPTVGPEGGRRDVNF